MVHLSVTIHSYLPKSPCRAFLFGNISSVDFFDTFVNKSIHNVNNFYPL